MAHDLENGDDRLLLKAAHLGDTYVVKWHVEHGADVNTIDEHCETALRKAERKGHIEIVKYLKEQGAKKVDIRAVFDAAWGGYIEIVKWYLVHGTDVIDWRHERGATLLHFACRGGHLSMVEFLVENGAKVNAETKVERYTPLIDSVIYARPARDQITRNHIARDHIAIAKYLVKHGADINAKEHDEGGSALHYVASDGNMDLVKCFVQHGADLELQDRYGRTPLCIAVVRGDLPLIEYLHGQGADINVQKGPWGKTTLFYAVFHDRLDIVIYLVEHGARVNTPVKIAHNLGRRVDATMLYIARREGHADIAKYLKDHGAEE